jgi:cation transport ATPase
LLRRAAGVALGSEHPLARGIIESARTRGLAPVPVEGIQAHPGAGAVALAPVMTAIGSSALIGKLGWSVPADFLSRTQQLADVSSLVYVGWNGVVYGVLLFRWDAVSEAKPTIETLKAQGLHAALLSGDNPCATEQVAQALGIELWRGGLSAEAKVLALNAIAKQIGPVVMVGDGLNDAPVLACASIGIAVGAATDLARETADVALPAGGLRDLPWLVALARRVRTTIIVNIAWAFGYNLVALAAASAGLLQPILAAALMAGSSFFVLATSVAMNRRTLDGQMQPFPQTASLTAAAGR